jgi:cell division protein FtsZ
MRSRAYVLLLAAARALRAPAAGRRRGRPLAAAPGAAPELRPCAIRVVGVGGGGCNAVSRMVRGGVRGVDFWCVNTDAQALAGIDPASAGLHIGQRLTRGLGAGGEPGVGRDAARESAADIAEMVRGADLVFVTAGMGGGTGSGAAPVVAAAAKGAGALTVGVVTKPFGFEGRKRARQAVAALEELEKAVDTLIVVSNDRLLSIVPADAPLGDAFLVADDVLRQGIVGVSEIIVKPGLINVDFADVRSVMQDSGAALIGIGTGRGPRRAEDAAVAAISSPLLEAPVLNARGIVFNVVGGPSMTLAEVDRAARIIYENVDADANIIFGALVQDGMGDELSITVLATGIAATALERAVSSAVDVRPLLPGVAKRAGRRRRVPAFLRRK